MPVEIRSDQLEEIARVWRETKFAKAGLTASMRITRPGTRTQRPGLVSVRCMTMLGEVGKIEVDDNGVGEFIG